MVPFDKTKVHLLSELDDRRTVYISDSVAPQTVDAFTIMITSPRRSRYHEFDNSQPCEQLAFPPFSWAEIQAMHGTCFPCIAEADVRARYSLGGGIPRYVFGYSYEKLDREIQAAMTGVDLDAMVIEMDSPIIETDTKQSHRLLHMLPRGVVGGASELLPTSLDFYAPAQLELASSEVASRVYAKAEQTATLRLHKLLAEPPSSPAHAALYQSMYENAVLAELSKGCSLTCWDSTVDKFYTLSVPQCKRTYFDGIAALGGLFAVDRQQLLVPRSKSFTAIDAILPGGRMAQVTISLNHDVKLFGRGSRSSEGLVPTFAALHRLAGSSDSIDLYWILPEAQFDELVRSKKPPFPLIIPDEVDAGPELSMLDKLQVALAMATAAVVKAAASGSDAQFHTAQKAAETAKTELEQKQGELAPRIAQWAALKKRVRHFAVCMQFKTNGSLGLRSALIATASAEEADCYLR